MQRITLTVVLLKAGIVAAISVIAILWSIAGAQDLPIGGGNGEMVEAPAADQCKQSRPSANASPSSDSRNRDLAGIDCFLCLPICMLDPSALGCSVCLATCSITPV